MTLVLGRKFLSQSAYDLDYTYQVAEGANSNPVEEFGAVLAGDEPTRSIIPLDWDQTHNLNGSIFANYQKWGANAVFQFGSGYPKSDPQCKFVQTAHPVQPNGEPSSNVFQKND